jgi:hypothetical protein
MLYGFKGFRVGTGYNYNRSYESSTLQFLMQKVAKIFVQKRKGYINDWVILKRHLIIIIVEKQPLGCGVDPW